MSNSRVARLLGAPERRAVSVDDFDLRAEADEIVLDGYASIFDAPYEVAGGPDDGGWLEVVDKRAFDRTLSQNPDVHLLVNHEGMPLARTKSGTLELRTDKKGLRVEARLDRRDPDVQRLEVKMERKDMDEMSFAFRTIRHEFDEEAMERRLLEVNIHKGDVSVVNFGANPATSTGIRSIEEAIEVLANADRDLVAVELRKANLIVSKPDAPRLTLAEAERLAL